MRSGLVGVLLVSATLLLSAGCDDSKTAEVSGSVTVDGVALESGSITFVPADGQSSTAGGTIKNGHYSVKVPVGQMKVSISMPKVVSKKKLYNTPNSPEGDVTAEGLPARYNAKTELSLEVKSGKNPKNWDLKGK